MKIIEIRIVKDGGILSPSDLPALCGRVEEIASSDWAQVYVLSGRMPVWAYAALCHKLHPCQGVGCFEPRSGTGIVVSRHSGSCPEVGSSLPLEGVERIEVVV